MQRTKVQRGFSLIEVLISMVVLTIGLISLLGVFGLAMAATQDAHEDLAAKQLANEAMESIITARNTAQLQWSDIQNASKGGIFLDDYQNIYTAQGDGIFGTADDVAGAQFVALHEPGPDGIYNNADDTTVQLKNFQRKIEIRAFTDPLGNDIPSLRSVDITIRYSTPRMATPKTFVLNSLISQFR